MENLSAVVNVRLTVDEKAALKESATLSGLSVSEYVRRRVLGRVVMAHSDIVVIQELRRLGGLLKHLHNESNGCYAAETGAVLEALRDAILRVGKES